MTVFVDTSVWYAAADRGDCHNFRAKEILIQQAKLVTSDHVLLETWLLLQHRLNRSAALKFWQGLRSGIARIEPITLVDLEAAWHITQYFKDQDFSLGDCTSFAVMERLGIRWAASFDDDFLIYRSGDQHKEALKVIR